MQEYSQSSFSHSSRRVLILELNHTPCNYPRIIPLMNSKEKLKCRQVKAVLRYHVPNCHKHLEKYAHHLLFMFYPFRNEQDLMSDNSGTYCEKLQEPGIIDIINRNKLVFEPYGNLVESTLLNLRTNLASNQDSYNNNMFCFSPKKMVQNIIHRIREKCNITHINNFIYVCFAPSSF